MRVVFQVDFFLPVFAILVNNYFFILHEVWKNCLGRYTYSAHFGEILSTEMQRCMTLYIRQDGDLTVLWTLCLQLESWLTHNLSQPSIVGEKMIVSSIKI